MIEEIRAFLACLILSTVIVAYTSAFALVVLWVFSVAPLTFSCVLVVGFTILSCVKSTPKPPKGTP